MNRLQTIREAAEISVRELGDASGVSAETIMRAEHPEGRTRPASMTKIVDGLNTILSRDGSEVGTVSLWDVFPEAASERRGHGEAALGPSDSWATMWADRALQDLGRCLVGYGVEIEHAALAVERTWLFYSYVVIPTVRRHSPMGIAARRGQRARTCLYLPRPTRDHLEERPAEPVERILERGFAREVAEPLAPWIDMKLNLVTGREAGAEAPDAERRWLDAKVRTSATSHHLDYIGVFVDDLVEELGTVMDRRDVVRWLTTPNTLFAGDAPRESLRDPLDQRLRDVVLRAKFDLSAA